MGKFTHIIVVLFSVKKDIVRDLLYSCWTRQESIEVVMFYLNLCDTSYV
jgi:hypothetical protein